MIATSGWTGEQNPFCERLYAAARRVRWGHRTTYGALAKELGVGPEAARDVRPATWPRSGGADQLAAGSWLGVSFPPGRSRAKTLMLALEASASSHRDRLNDFLRS
jgi:methylated-DNA-[protein]-cysteine S-methyltransferase